MLPPDSPAYGLMQWYGNAYRTENQRTGLCSIPSWVQGWAEQGYLGQSHGSQLPYFFANGIKNWCICDATPLVIHIQWPPGEERMLAIQKQWKGRMNQSHLYASGQEAHELSITWALPWCSSDLVAAQPSCTPCPVSSPLQGLASFSVPKTLVLGNSSGLAPHHSRPESLLTLARLDCHI